LLVKGLRLKFVIFVLWSCDMFREVIPIAV
jgi:hypothetical protein